ncbi:MAG: hypothetical protein QXN14_01400 [Ignisphaera sp.]
MVLIPYEDLLIIPELCIELFVGGIERNNHISIHCNYIDSVYG